LETYSNDEQKVKTLFRKIVSRSPQAAETERLLAYLDESNQDDSVEKDIDNVSPKFKIPEHIEPIKFRAYTRLTTLLFNLDETINKS